jgi:cytochrome c553
MKKSIRIALAATTCMFAGQIHAAGDAELGKAKSYACSACHGVDGKREVIGAPGLPRLAGKSQEHLVNATKAYRAGSRFHPLMQVLLWTMSDKDIEDLAAYYSGIKD